MNRTNGVSISYFHIQCKFLNDTCSYSIHFLYLNFFSLFIHSLMVPSSSFESMYTDAHMSFWQSPLWAQILERSGQAHECFFFSHDGYIVPHDALMDHSPSLLVEIRSIGLRQRGAFIIGVEWDIPSNTLESLFHLLRRKNVLFLQIEPLERALCIWRKSLYRHFLTERTRIIDLSLSEERIFQSMHEKGRYNIRIAEKSQIHVERVRVTRENIDAFIWLLKETTLRDRFAHNSRLYYEHFLTVLENHDAGWLYLARFGDRVIAASILVLTRERAIYYYGASTSENDMRKLKAPELLQWRMIQDAKLYGSRVYDFLWVADPHDPTDPLTWVSQFKAKFGGDVILLPEKKIFPLSWKYSVFMKLYLLKKKLRKR